MIASTSEASSRLPARNPSPVESIYGTSAKLKRSFRVPLSISSFTCWRSTNPSVPATNLPFREIIATSSWKRDETLTDLPRSLPMSDSARKSTTLGFSSLHTKVQRVLERSPGYTEVSNLRAANSQVHARRGPGGCQVQSSCSCPAPAVVKSEVSRSWALDLAPWDKKPRRQRS